MEAVSDGEWEGEREGGRDRWTDGKKGLLIAVVCSTVESQEPFCPGCGALMNVFSCVT